MNSYRGIYPTLSQTKRILFQHAEKYEWLILRTKYFIETDIAPSSSLVADQTSKTAEYEHLQIIEKGNPIDCHFAFPRTTRLETFLPGKGQTKISESWRL